MQWKTAINHTALGGVLAILTACTHSEISCSDLTGEITHRTTEITGINKITIERQDPSTGVIEAVDQFNGVEFSNLAIRIDLSWIEEQHRYNAPSIFIQSFVEWMLPAAFACSVAVPTQADEFLAEITGINIFSDSNFNSNLIAGQELSQLFSITGLPDNNKTITEAVESGSFRSSRSYHLKATFKNNALIAQPATPANHIFTIRLPLENGREYEARSQEFLISGV